MSVWSCVWKSALRNEFLLLSGGQRVTTVNREREEEGDGGFVVMEDVER